MADHSAYYVIRVKHLWLSALLLAGVIAGLLVIISSVLADSPADLPANANDGRINVVHHFGGDVLYCVNKDNIATHDFFSSAEGGFRLLNMHGEPLWFVPAATVLEKVAEAQPGEGNVLVAEGQGTYGPAAIYTYKMTDGTIRFIFTGVDEHGSQNQMDFERCLPVNPPGGSNLCSFDEVNEAVIRFYQSGNLSPFVKCYDRICPDVSYYSYPANRDCFCAKYPSSLACTLTPT